MKFLLILMMLPSIAICQQKGFVLGYVVTYKSDTLYGLVNISDENPYRTKGNIRFKADNGTQKENYSPDELAEFNAGGVKYKSMFLKSKKRKYFFEVKAEGFLSYYLLAFNGRTFWNPETIGAVKYHGILQRRNEYTQFEFPPGDPFFEFTDMMTEYLKDDTELCEKIRNRSYKNRKEDIDMIVQEYNNFILVQETQR